MNGLTQAPALPSVYPPPARVEIDESRAATSQHLFFFPSNTGGSARPVPPRFYHLGNPVSALG